MTSYFLRCGQPSTPTIWRTLLCSAYCVFHCYHIKCMRLITKFYGITPLKQAIYALAYRLHDKLQPWNEQIVPTGFVVKSLLKSNIASRSSRNTKQIGMFFPTAWHRTSLFSTQGSPRPPHQFFIHVFLILGTVGIITRISNKLKLDGLRALCSFPTWMQKHFQTYMRPHFQAFHCCTTLRKIGMMSNYRIDSNKTHAN